MEKFEKITLVIQSMDWKKTRLEANLIGHRRWPGETHMAQIRRAAWELDRCEIFWRWGHKQQSLIDVVHEGEEESRTLPGV